MNFIAKAAKMLQTIREIKHVIEVQKPVYLDTKNQDFFELEVSETSNVWRIWIHDQNY